MNLSFDQCTLADLNVLVEISRSAFITAFEKDNNPDAIRLYERHHFKKFSKHPYYVGRDKQMDWLMKLDLV